MTKRAPKSATTQALALKKVARTLRRSAIIEGTLEWLVLSSGPLLGLVLLDHLLPLPSALRLPLVAALGIVAAVGFHRRVLRPLLRPVSPEQAARALEIRHGLTDNILINAYQLQATSTNPGQSESFLRPVIDRSRSVLGEIAPRRLWWTAALRKWGLAGLVLAGAWTLGAIVFPRYMTNGVERLFLPLADVPPAGAWSLEVQPTGTVAVTEGDPLAIRVRVHAASGTAKTPPLPVLSWKEGTAPLETTPRDGERAPMLATGTEGEFVFTFGAGSITKPFRFRVWADDACSAATTVTVSPLPRLKGALFQVLPPAYTGLKPYPQPGPPVAHAVPAGSTVQALFDLVPSSTSGRVFWKNASDKHPLPLTGEGGHWKTTFKVAETLSYEIAVATTPDGAPKKIAQGEITALPDKPPEVDFVTDDRNRLVNPGGKLPVVLRARDDYGVATMALRLSRSDDPSSDASTVLQTWTLSGPPGEKEPPTRAYTVPLDPALFTPGASFLLTAEAADFNPANPRSVSAPLVVRVAGLQDLSVPPGDPLEKLFALLRAAIADQTRANGLTDTLSLHLAEALAAKDTPRHRDAISAAQRKAQGTVTGAADEADRHTEAKAFQARLRLLAKGEIGLAVGQIDALAKAPPSGWAPPLAALQKRQQYILNELISLLGQIAGDRQDAAAKAKAAKAGEPPAPSPTAQQELAGLRDDLKSFLDSQKKIVDMSKSLLDRKPEDLTAEQEALLGELAREEAKNAAYFQEKLTDLSKLPVQDFADGKLITEVNSVFQEVQAAAAALYEKKVELAVPREEAGLELASELEQNLEKWLPNTPDNTKWSMEEPTTQADVPMAELPKQMEDLVGDLLDKEEAMGDDVEDVSSTFMDSIDKGAGWGAGDGPISNMSARGVTGNQLPNNNEVGGRSGEGRTGKSSGQMVGDTAEGKDGRQTPTRLNGTPFEAGSVKDTSKDTKGGATGGGKLAGSGEEGLRGPLPPPALEKMKRLAEQQVKLRQQAEALVVQLRQQRRPTGELEAAIAAMKKMEASGNTQNGLGLFQGYHQALDALASASTAASGSGTGRVSRVEGNASGNRAPQQGVADAQAEGIPAGYEEMTGAYFRSLNESPAATNPPAGAPK